MARLFTIEIGEQELSLPETPEQLAEVLQLNIPSKAPISPGQSNPTFPKDVPELLEDLALERKEEIGAYLEKLRNAPRDLTYTLVSVEDGELYEGERLNLYMAGLWSKMKADFGTRRRRQRRFKEYLAKLNGLPPLDPPRRWPDSDSVVLRWGDRQQELPEHDQIKWKSELDIQFTLRISQDPDLAQSGSKPSPFNWSEHDFLRRGDIHLSGQMSRDPNGQRYYKARVATEDDRDFDPCILMDT